MGINHPNPHSFFLIFIIDDGMHHTISFEGKITCLHCPRDQGSIGIEIASKRTAPLTNISTGTKSPALLHIDGLAFGEVGTSAVDHMAIVVVLFHLLAEVILNAVVSKRP